MKTLIAITMTVSIVGSVAFACGHSGIEETRTAARGIAQAGEDQRQLVTHDEQVQEGLGGIGVLTVDGKFAGGGTYVTRSCVLVSLHSVTNGESDAQATRDGKLNRTFTFHAGQNGNSDPSIDNDFSDAVQGHVIAHGKGLIVNNRNTTNKDWAVIRLDRPMNNDISTIPLCESAYSLKQKSELPNNVSLYQYPLVAKNTPTNFTMWSDTKCNFLDTGTQQFWFHNCQTSDGSSGGPVVVTENGAKCIAAMNSGEQFNPANKAQAYPLYRYSDQNRANLAVNLDSGSSIDAHFDGDDVRDALNSDSCK